MDINKDLIAASSTPIVLAILAEEDSYGYAIIKRVKEASEGRMEWTDGMLYPVLHRLERLGYAKARWGTAESGRRRKYYRITAQGRAQLAEERRQWQAVDATLRGIWHGFAAPLPARRAALERRASIWTRALRRAPASLRLRAFLSVFVFDSFSNETRRRKGMHKGTKRITPASGFGGAAFGGPLL